MAAMHPDADESWATFSQHAPSGAIVHASPGTCELLGGAPEALLGRSYFDFVHPDDAAELQAIWIAAAAGPEARIATYRIRRSGDQHRWVETTLCAMRHDATGDVTGICCISRDVTAQRAAHRAHQRLTQRMHRLTQRMEGIIRSVPGVIWESIGQWEEGKLRLSFISDHVRAMTGYTAEEIVASTDRWFALIHPEDRDRVMREIQAFHAEESGSTQYRWIGKDERVTWVETHVTHIKDETGASVGMRGVTLDITARKAAERQQEIIRAQAEALLELSTPLIPISEEVMVMPLVGALDAERGERAIEALLAGMSRSGARVVILDVTGVPTIDTRVADALRRAARSVQLLGAEVVLTGIRPDVARTLVALDIDLGRVTTRGTLQDGIAHALRSDGGRARSPIRK
jgi:PAS domain S-box-containing protein